MIILSRVHVNVFNFSLGNILISKGVTDWYSVRIRASFLLYPFPIIMKLP